MFRSSDVKIYGGDIERVSMEDGGEERECENYIVHLPSLKKKKLKKPVVAGYVELEW